MLIKERPIIMSGNHPELILDGTKTQTRRVIKPQPTILAEYAKLNEWGRWDFYGNNQVQCGFVCPYGQVGDRLWVRETHRLYEASGYYPRTVRYYIDADNFDKENLKWRPSIYMPRWASRITFEITEVRVERLQEILPSDCVAEGISADIAQSGPLTLRDFISPYARLWNSLNAKRGYGWETNPWVWVILFRLLSINANEN